MSNGEEMSLCPFCGGVGEPHPYDADGPPYEWHVICEQCGARSSLEPTEAEAIAAWNRRSSPSAAEAAEELDPSRPCRTCGGITFALVDVRQPDGSWAKGNLQRCVECKEVRSTAEAQADYRARILSAIQTTPEAGRLTLGEKS